MPLKNNPLFSGKRGRKIPVNISESKPTRKKAAAYVNDGPHRRSKEENRITALVECRVWINGILPLCILIHQRG